MFRTALMTFAIACSLGIPCNASATVTEYSNKQQWTNAASQFTTIPFTGFPDNTIITNQYAKQGVLFTDGLDLTFLHNNLFPNDGAGLHGALNTIAVSFAAPVTSIAADFPGFIRFRLYRQGQLMYTSNELGWGGVGNFGGLVSDQPFDSAIISDDDVFIDDLFFGPPIPAPGAMALFGVAALAVQRRRRKW